MDSSQRTVEHQARRLRELFRGRFSQQTAEKLVEDFGGEQPALDFLLKEDENEVANYLRKGPDYLSSLRKDSQNLASILENGFKESFRMFGCGKCERSWWKKVPLRKKVSECRRCKTKYDPIPKDKEWGWGKFMCICGNEFTGFAIMNVTTSTCYGCEALCPVDHILPPRRDRPKKMGAAPHSCNGANCYNGDDRHMPHGGYGDDMGHLNHGIQRMSLNQGYAGASNTDAAGAYPGPAPQPTCIHPKSMKAVRRRLHWESQKHTSTGSTVSNVFSQCSLDTGSVASSIALCSIAE